MITPRLTPSSARALAAAALSLILICAAGSGCSEESRPAPLGPTGSQGGSGGSDGGQGGSCGSVLGGGGIGGSDGGQGGAGGSVSAPTRLTISGDATWTVTFDAAAQAAGAVDCAYTRHYEGVQDDSAPWLCPECEIMFRTDVTMPVGLDCYQSVIGAPDQPFPLEWVGWAHGTWWRGRGGPMSEQGTASVDADAGSVTTLNDVQGEAAPMGGTLAFLVTGSFTLGEEEGDPLHGFGPTNDLYQCGWPKSDPSAYQGDYLLTVGEPLPDGVFRDRCGDNVRLHDFSGDYLVVDMSAMDCGPCQAWAGDEEQLVTALAAQGITVHVITLLAPALDDPIGETTTSMLNTWVTTFSLTSPVLADRAFGLCMFLPIYGDETGYPSWALVAPDLTVLQTGNGYNGFGEIQAAILAHAGG